MVSPVTFKQRFNAVATSEQPEPAPGDLPSQVDPRQMSLFGAGWTVGSLGQMLTSGVASVTYYETTGWRGVIQGDAASAAPNRFPARAGIVFPLYHVFADLAEWKDGAVIHSRSSDPHAVESLALADDDGLHLLVANLTPEPRLVAIDDLGGTAATLRRLNAESAERATSDPTGFRSHLHAAAAHATVELTLAPFEVARLDLAGWTES